MLGADFYDSLAAQGFAVAAIDYRLSGEPRFPAPLEDVRTAVGWIRDHAGFYGLDARRLFLWGDSSGGHLALLAALTGTKVQGVVAWFPGHRPGRPAVRRRGRGRCTGTHFWNGARDVSSIVRRSIEFLRARA